MRTGLLKKEIMKSKMVDEMRCNMGSLRGHFNHQCLLSMSIVYCSYIASVFCLELQSCVKNAL